MSIAKKPLQSGFFGFFLGSGGLATGAKNVPGEIFHPIEGKEFEFCNSGKGRVKVDDFIWEALSSLPSFILQDDTHDHNF